MCITGPPWWLSSKESVCNAGDIGDTGSIPGREDPWRMKWKPTPVILPVKSYGQRSLAGYSPWGHKDLDMTERLKREREMDKNKHPFASVTAITAQDYNQKSLCLKGALNTCRCWQIESVGSVSYRTNRINPTHLLKTCFILISQRASPFHW